MTGGREPAEGGSGGFGGTPGGGAAGAPGSTGGVSPRDPLCPGRRELDTHDSADVWSDRTGVFVRLDSTLYSDTGSGWSSLETTEAGPGGLTGFEGGELVYYGSSSGCGIELIDRDGVIRCSGASEPAHVHVVARDLAYATYGDYVLSFDGTYWTQRGEALGELGTVGARQVWADREVIAVAGEGGLYVARGAAEFQRLSELDPEDGSAPGLTAVWVFPGKAIFAGTRRGALLEYPLDGRSPSVRRPADDDDDDCGRVRDLWGASDETLFVATSSRVSSVTDAGERALLDLPCGDETRVWGLWGSASNDVFVVYETGAPESDCGDVRLSYFDGVTLAPR